MQVLLVDSDGGRRAARAASLRVRGHAVHEVGDAVQALADLPRVAPDVLVLALAGTAIDLETLARGVDSMRAAGNLKLLAVGDAPPLSGAAQAIVSVMPDTDDPEAFARECERVAARVRRRR